MNSKKRAFKKVSGLPEKKRQEQHDQKIQRLKKYCDVIRVIATTQMKKLNFR